MLDFLKAPLDLGGNLEDCITRIAYRPTDCGMGDFCFASDAAGLHCFFIARMNHLGADCHGLQQETAIGHCVGETMFHMKKVEDAIRTRDNHCDNGHVWAPSIVFYNNQWHMFYTAVTDRLYQTIAVARSVDLFAWTAEANPVIDSGNYPWAMACTRGYTNCRDPYVVNFDGTWYCYYTVRLVNGNAGIGVSTSPDLLEWTDKGACLERPYQDGENRGTEMCESPCVFSKDGIYYLVYNQGMSIKYAVSDNPCDYSRSPIRDPYCGSMPEGVPYNFELLDVDTGLFGYLWGGYFSQLKYGYCDIDNGRLVVRKISTR